MREYETLFVLRPHVSEKELEETKERITKLIAAHQGKILLHRFWGKRQLGYPISKEKEGIYIHLDYTGDDTVVAELEKILRLDEKVLRFLTVVLNKKVDIAKRTQELAEAEAALQTMNT